MDKALRSPNLLPIPETFTNSLGLCRGSSVQASTVFRVTGRLLNLSLQAQGDVMI